MATTNESAAYAKQLVRGEKYGPGILNKLDRWFMDAMFTKHKDRFIPTDAALKQLKQAGFSDDQISIIRDAAISASYVALDRMIAKYPERVPTKYVSRTNSTAFQLGDLYLNVSEELHDEYLELMQKLFDSKLDKQAAHLDITPIEK
jgi:hypothetical protein